MPSNKKEKIFCIDQAKRLYFINYANYYNMMRNGEYDEYMQYHISEDIEREWSRELLNDIMNKIQSGQEDMWSVITIANIRLDASEIIKSIQIIAKTYSSSEIIAIIEKAKPLISSEIYDGIKRVLHS